MRTQEEVLLMLLKNNFVVKTTKGCFDIIARKGDKMLLIKVPEDVNSLSTEMLEQMKNASSALQAPSVIVSRKASKKLQDNVIYTRQDVPAMSPNTLQAYVHDHPLYVMSKKAGAVVSIDGKKMQEIRKESEMSLGQAARKLGVSTRMVVKYEDSNAEVSWSKSARIAEVFGNEIFKQVDIGMTTTSKTIAHPSEISLKYGDLGFWTAETKKVPFDIVAKKQSTIILTSVGEKVNQELGDISRTLGVDELAIVKKKRPSRAPSLTMEEFMEVEKASSLIKFIHEYQEDHQ